MATATVKTMVDVVKRTVEEYVDVKKVVLTLDWAEAETLYSIQRRVGGDARKTYRGDWDNIGKALRDAGVGQMPYLRDVNGNDLDERWEGHLVSKERK